MISVLSPLEADCAESVFTVTVEDPGFHYMTKTDGEKMRLNDVKFFYSVTLGW